jgi:holo-[acyl-carrier protein] synthase
VVGIGHDLQLLSELEGRPALSEPELLFSVRELEVTAAAGCGRLLELATRFSVKEAFFKALPVQSGWLWCELELERNEQGRPFLNFRGALRQLMAYHGWTAQVSVSHSGAYVSSFVVICGA